VPGRFWISYRRVRRDGRPRVGRTGCRPQLCTSRVTRAPIVNPSIQIRGNARPFPRRLSRRAAWIGHPRVPPQDLGPARSAAIRVARPARSPRSAVRLPS